MKTRIWMVSACALLMVATGCVLPDQLAQIQKDLADVRQELRRVQQSQTESTDRLTALESRVGSAEEPVARTELADLGLDLQRATRNVDVTAEQVSEMSRRMDRLAEEVRQSRSSGSTRQPSWSSGSTPGMQPTTPPTTTPAPRPGGDSAPEPESLYNTAYADFSKGNYALAISGFREFQERFGDSPLADNALYWIGECQFSQGDFSQAVRSFDALLDRYPDTDKAAAANLKKALAYLEQNQIGQAIVQLRFVRTSYPGSDEAKIARDKLTSLGAPI